MERKEGEIEKQQSRDSARGLTPLTVHILSALPHCPSGSSVSVCTLRMTPGRENALPCVVCLRRLQIIVIL